VNWFEHQVISKGYLSPLAACEFPNHSRNIPGTFRASRARGREGKGKERNVTGNGASDGTVAESDRPTLKGTPLDPALIAACPFCDEQGWLWRGDVIEGRCSHIPQHRTVNVDEAPHKPQLIVTARPTQ
jgi:hypothetical protein